MKKMVFLALIAVAFIAAPALAANPYVLSSGGGVNTAQYHSYDGLICTDCHTLHNSEGGAAVGAAGYATASPYRELLKRGDWTDMCLSCHKQGNNTAATADLPGVSNGVDPVTGVDYGNWTAPIVMTLDGVDPAGIAMPAGDFYYSNLDPKRGHNPAYTKGAVGGAATSLKMTSDPVLGSTPPGGAINDGEWSCHSCHGMHARFSGSYSAWRQLKRKVNNICIDKTDDGNVVDHILGDCGTGVVQDPNYEPIKSNSRGDIFGGVNNTNYVAVRGDLNPLEGANLFADESDSNKNVYRGGFSSFCSTCHGAFHGGNGETRATNNTNTRVAGTWVKHPTNVAMNEAGSKYGITTYTAVITNAQNNNPNPVGYDWKYPLVQPDADFTVLSSAASAGNAATAIGSDRIMCLTCHKAHASSYENMTRWDANNHSFIANGATDFTGETSSGDNPAYGCGKCHQKGGTKAFVKTGF